MKSKAVTVLRRIRTFIYFILWPFDVLFLKINRLSKYPPLYLRRHVHQLGTIDGTGSEFAVYLKMLGNLKNMSRVLDLGCGCGLLELALEDYLTKGEVVAVDIHKPSITWAQETIGKRKPNFRFIHSNIYSEAYWRSGTDSKTFFASFIDSNFDVIVAKSLFTHMLTDELEIYVTEVSRRLNSNGRAILTFFLLNEEQQDLANNGKNQINFHQLKSSDPYAVRNQYAPTAAVGYVESYIKDLLRRNSLKFEYPVQYGFWTGRENALHFQDIIVVSREL